MKNARIRLGQEILRRRKAMGMTQEELAAKIGKSRSAIANAQRLLDLPEELLALIATRSLSAGHARALRRVSHRYNALLAPRRSG